MRYWLEDTAGMPNSESNAARRVGTVVTSAQQPGFPACSSVCRVANNPRSMGKCTIDGRELAREPGFNIVRDAEVPWESV